MRRGILLGMIFCETGFFLTIPKALGKTSLPLEIILIWEGRELRAPNMEALKALRDEFADLQILHLISPQYLYAEEQRRESLSQMQSIILERDEIGLYLTAQQRVLNEARVVARSQPTFWSLSGDSGYCSQDCGLDVPLSSFNREDQLKVFSYSDSILRKSGFSRMKTYAIRGGLDSSFVKDFSSSLQYQFDLSPVDPQILNKRFHEFPWSRWLQSRWYGSALSTGDVSVENLPEDIQKVFQAQGGFVDLSEPIEVRRRFERFMENYRAQKNLGFSLIMSQETAFQGVARLKYLLANFRKLAQDKDIDLIFRTRSGAKNGRPHLADEHITGNP